MANVTDDPWLTERQQEVWRRWLFVTQSLPTALAHQLAQDSGLSLPDFEVLVILSESDGGRIRISALADRLQWERSRLSHHVTRMAKRGLVEKHDCPDDGRGAYVVLTDAGRASIVDAAPGHARLVRRLLFDESSATQVDQLDHYLRGIADRLDTGPAEA